MNGILLDTHAWLWSQIGTSGKLSSETRGEIEGHQRRGSAWLSAYSTLELARLVYFGDYELPMDIDSFVAEALRDDGLRLLDTSPSIFIASVRLPGDMHRDPADRVLVASAREYGLTLYTHDRKILRYAEAGYVSAREL